jgi:hypothetical protein
MEQKTLTVLHRAYMQPFSTQSNYARQYAVEVAELASRGLLTTQIWRHQYGKHWRVSAAGLALLEMTTIGETECATSS